jgi:hypothetical protein
MSEHQAKTNQLEPDAIDASRALDVTGPTFKQELFLRQQKRWRDDLTRQQASNLIDERLRELHERKLNQTRKGSSRDDGHQRAE